MSDAADKLINAKTVNEYSKMPFKASEYMDMRGVVDFGNLAQFAPYESGYCFLAVISAPYCMSSAIGTSYATKSTKLQSRAKYHSELQNAFIKVLEQEFKGLDGIDDITSETMEISDNISTMSLISKTVQNSNNQLTMRFTEKSGSLITKYISTFLRIIKDTRTEAKTYGGIINADNVYKMNPGPQLEVFNMLYIITDSTCLRVEKAFLILNAQPITASYSDLYNSEKGNIESKEISVTFNAFVVDGNIADKIALCYMREMVNTSEYNKSGKININSWNYNWSYSNEYGNNKHVADMVYNRKTKKLSVPHSVVYEEKDGVKTRNNNDYCYIPAATMKGIIEGYRSPNDNSDKNKNKDIDPYYTLLNKRKDYWGS